MIPTDDELLAALPGAASLSRVPYEYATSSPLHELEVRFDDGRVETLLLKHLMPGSKPPFLYEPRRDIDTYLRILGPAGIGARCYAAGDTWQVLEKVPGVELWQIGDLAVWEAVARWLAAFHARFAGEVAAVRAANPHLLAYDAGWYRLWFERAASALPVPFSAYDAVVDALCALPATFVHGELYPSNVLVADGATDVRVCPVDWEMAASGPGLVDLAALTAGWDEAERTRLVKAYGDVDVDALDRCRLHLALQWLGWSPGWAPPPEHAHDWRGEALELAERLGVL
ncbi:MAG: phosphotransferase family protein [Acidimicrobiales bacterium]